MSEISPEQEPQIISAQEARALLEATIRQKLGDRWDDEESGWIQLTGHDYMARFTRGRNNVDFYVDLTGEVRIEENEINGAQEYGRFLAWGLLFGSLLLAFVIAWAAGYL